MLRSIPNYSQNQILQGVGDDAAVIRLDSNKALVQTIDYISPVVDDPYGFGQVAAANALSDIYAMGGTPSFALNIIGFPINTLPMSVMQEILRGGADKLNEVGVPIVGGHSYEDHAPKYGLAVTGSIDPERYVSKKGAKPGDVLVLTKSIGIGAITTGIDIQITTPELEEKVLTIMTTLNQTASAAMMRIGVHACTDVTGFGLLGHLYEMLTASLVSAEISVSRIPVIPEAWEMIRRGAISNGTRNNKRMLQEIVKWESAIPEEVKWLLYDAQTSGGLLIAVPLNKKDSLIAELQRSDCVAAVIGNIKEKRTPLIQIVE